MIYELRTYRAMPGKMPNLLSRFRDHTCRIWEAHGIRQLGMWTVEVGQSNNDLIYILVWESMGDRERKWTQFRRDPEWKAALAASEADGPLVQTLSSQFLVATDFSATS